MASAGVALLQDIKTMFEASTLDYLTSKTIIERLTADPEKPWAEWSRGKAITEKGVAALLHEYRIVSRTVGPRDAHARGYRRADFADAWQRYLTPKAEETTGGLDSDNLPLICLPPCSDSDFAEKSAVDGGGGQREKNGHLSSEINAVNTSTGKTAKIGPALSFSAPPDPGPIPAFLDRSIPADRQPALGPEGDNLDDFR